MPRTQALMIQIATGDPRPISKQIVDGVRMKIATAELEPGAQLPSVRGLAQQLMINPNTVAKAYAELTSEGCAFRERCGPEPEKRITGPAQMRPVRCGGRP